MQVGKYRKRRVVVFLILCTIFCFVIVTNTPQQTKSEAPKQQAKEVIKTDLAINALNSIQIKSRLSKADYSRDKFGSGWASSGGCDTRNIILNRDLTEIVFNNKCEVASGKLDDPYTGKIILFKRGLNSGDVQIDHVVALSNAWQTGAQLFTQKKRIEIANNPLELLAVDGKTNMDKSDGDAATWLPPNKPFRCQYVARQVAVKQKYKLWVSRTEYNAISNILKSCPAQQLPAP